MDFKAALVNISVSTIGPLTIKLLYCAIDLVSHVTHNVFSSVVYLLMQKCKMSCSSFNVWVLLLLRIPVTVPLPQYPSLLRRHGWCCVARQPAHQQGIHIVQESKFNPKLSTSLNVL